MSEQFLFAVVRMIFASGLAFIAGMLRLKDALSEENALALWTASIGLASANALDSTTKAAKKVVEKVRNHNNGE